MNILILCAGRRVNIIEYFKKALEESTGAVFAADMNEYAPAFQAAHASFQVSGNEEDHYIDEILEICREQKVAAVIAFMDSELELLAANRSRFEAIGVVPIVSSEEMVELSADKYAMHQFLIDHGIRTVPTYECSKLALAALANNEFTYPFIMKPLRGSTSVGFSLLNDQADFDHTIEEMIFQPYYKDKEYGIDVYVDLQTGELVDLFIKEKLRMRLGQTDQAISLHIEEIAELIIDFVSCTDFRGPLDIDVFQFEGNFFLSEVNPRFGAGYSHAYECGIDFAKYIVQNLKGLPNKPYTGFSYEAGKVMAKYDAIMIL